MKKRAMAKFRQLCFFLFLIVFQNVSPKYPLIIGCRYRARYTLPCFVKLILKVSLALSKWVKIVILKHLRESQYIQ